MNWIIYRENVKIINVKGFLMSLINLLFKLCLVLLIIYFICWIIIWEIILWNVNVNNSILNVINGFIVNFGILRKLLFVIFF